ncbi:odorant receptor 10a [Aedes aegypti]|uniref:Odorant receptor n=1 Tax=Aedes aegypti TaxID=7159 RepID=A0A1S4G631_AEDAE|nr:odorant receptor 66 [Aedes aegypti]
MEALDKFMLYTKYVRGLCSVIGLDILDPDYKKGFKTYFTFFLMILYVVLTVNSLLTAKGSTEVLMALSFGGFFGQCLLKLIFTLANRKQYYVNHTNLKESIYFKYLHGSEKEKSVIYKNVSQLLMLVKVTSLLYLSSIFLFSLYPAYMYFFENIKVTIFPLLVPGIDIYSAYGYGFTNMIHMFFGVYGLFGALSSDTAFMMFVFHIVSYTDLLQIHFLSFAEKLTSIEVKYKTKDYAAFCSSKMRELYVSHKEVIDFLSSLKMCYESICVVQVATCVVTISLNLFLALMSDWYATYGFLLASLFQLFIYAVLGTLIQLMNDKISTLVYDAPWHLLPNSDKRSFQFLLYKTQRPIEMFVRGLGPLNVETFTEIMRMIYSSFTMLYSFIVE